MENNKAPVNGGYPLHTFQEVEDIYMVYISSKEDRSRIEDAYHFILESMKDKLEKVVNHIIITSLKSLIS